MEQEVNLLIRDFWQKGTGSVAKSHVKKTLEGCLHEAAKGKKKNYLEAFLQKLQHFSLFFVSVYWLMFVEGEATLRSISICLAKKWQQP